MFNRTLLKKSLNSLAFYSKLVTAHVRSINFIFLSNRHLEKKIVIIPTYNEKENIASIIEAVFSLNKGFHILVIDDGSPDGTAQISKSCIVPISGSTFPGRKKRQIGIGYRLYPWIQMVALQGYQYIFEMDADFSITRQTLNAYTRPGHSGEPVWLLAPGMLKGGNVQNWPSNRIALSKGASLYTQLITWMPVKTHAGFVCYRREVLESINLDGISFIGLCIPDRNEICRLENWDTVFQEVPITFIDRKLVLSKMNKGIIKEGILGVIKLRWQSLF